MNKTEQIKKLFFNSDDNRIKNIAEKVGLSYQETNKIIDGFLSKEVNFPTRHKLKIIIKNVGIKEYKSTDYYYLLKKQSEFKEKYSPDDIYFTFSKSDILEIDKPNIFFKNLPDWQNVSYGINSDKGYYLKNKETNKIIRIYEL